MELYHRCITSKLLKQCRRLNTFQVSRTSSTCYWKYSCGSNCKNLTRNKTFRCIDFSSFRCKRHFGSLLIDSKFGRLMETKFVRMTDPKFVTCHWLTNKWSYQLYSKIPESNESKINDESKKSVAFNENIYTIPNMLCVTRIILSPAISYLILHDKFNLGLTLFAFAGITDLLDGFIARNFKNQQSMLGSFLDPVADKLLVATLFLSLTAAQLIPVPLTALIISRDAALLTAGFVVRYKSLPQPRKLNKYFDFTYATAKITPTFISKVNTAMQLFLVAATIGGPVFDYSNHEYLHYLWYATALTTVSSGLSYFFARNTYKLFKS